MNYLDDIKTIHGLVSLTASSPEAIVRIGPLDANHSRVDLVPLVDDDNLIGFTGSAYFRTAATEQGQSMLHIIHAEAAEDVPVYVETATQCRVRMMKDARMSEPAGMNHGLMLALDMRDPGDNRHVEVFLDTYALAQIYDGLRRHFGDA